MKRGIALSVLCLTVVMTGCGSSNAPAVASSGGVSLRIRWPADRLIPNAAESITVTLSDGAGWSVRQVATRPEGGGDATLVFDNVPVGLLQAVAAAYPTMDGSGVAQAAGAVQIEAVAGQTVTETVTMGSTIATFAITPTAVQLSVGQSATLTATARNAAGEVVLVPDQATWAITSGAECVTFANGRATAAFTTSASAVGAGDAVIGVSFEEAPGALRTSAAPVTVQAVSGQQAWIRQRGTAGYDWAHGVAVASGACYVAGSTEGLLGAAWAGGADAYLSRYEANGDVTWTRQFGTPANDAAHGVAADLAGNLYVSGYSYGTIEAANQGSGDVFLAKYDQAGSQVWVRQFGTAGHEQGSAVAASPTGLLYVTGQTDGDLGGPSAGGGDVFVACYDTSGVQQWTRQLGSGSFEGANGAACDAAGNVFVAGFTDGSLGGPNQGLTDKFLAKYSPAGTLLWVKQYGTAADDGASCVAVGESGAIYLGGYGEGVAGGPHAGYYDCWLARLDVAGAIVWQREFGTQYHDRLIGVAVDATGHVLAAGHTMGALFGPDTGSNDDLWVEKLSPGGLAIWTAQVGSTFEDRAGGLAVDALGDAYVVASTYGSLGDTNVGETDLVLSKYLSGPG